MTDKQFLEWLRQRLIHRYQESEFTDFVDRLKQLIAKMPENLPKQEKL